MKTILIFGLIFVAIAQAVISWKLFKLMRFSDSVEVVTTRKKLDLYSRVIQVAAMLIVFLYLFHGRLF
ncbi:MAG: hypothetical protein V4454_07215 [Pseudomonadota bacterium]